MDYTTLGQHLVTNQGRGSRMVEVLISILKIIVSVPRAYRMITTRERAGNGSELVLGCEASMKIDGQANSLTASGEAAEIRGQDKKGVGDFGNQLTAPPSLPSRDAS